MISSGEVEFCLYCHPQNLSKVTHELGVTIGGNGLWKSMKTDNFLEEQLSDFVSIRCVGTWNKLSNFGETINHNKD